MNEPLVIVGNGMAAARGLFALFRMTGLANDSVLGDKADELTCSLQVVQQALKKRMTQFALSGLRSVLDLGQQLRLNPDAVMRSSRRGVCVVIAALADNPTASASASGVPRGTPVVHPRTLIGI